MVDTPSFFFRFAATKWTRTKFAHTKWARAKLAAGLTFGLAVLLAATLSFSIEKPPLPVAAFRVPTEAPTSLRSYAYYPEQLAALSSMSNFQPVADPGLPTVVKIATPDVRPVRRPEFLGKPAPIALTPPALTTTAVTQAAFTQPARPPEAGAAKPGSAPVAQTPQKAAEPDRSWRILGLRVPTPSLPALPDGETLRRPVDGLRETAAGLGDKILHFWR